MRKMRFRLLGFWGLVVGMFLTGATFSWAQGQSNAVVVEATQHAFSPPLDQIVPIPPQPGPLSSLPVLPTHGPRATGQSPDPVLQGSPSATTLSTTSGQNFLGVGTGLNAFRVQYIPPDTNGAVGPTQFVQWVNASFAVFYKASGNLAYGPAAGNTLWQALGGPCATNNSGDPIAQFDKQANRWVLMQPVFKSPYYLCVAVSSSADAVQQPWYLYAFPIPGKVFPDYPKLGVWPDGYYVTYNQFRGQSFVGPAACALDRNSMLSGAPAKMQCFTNIGASYGSMLPGDVDGTPTTGPPAGSPEYLLNFGSNNASLDLWRFHVDWTTPSNSTLTSTGPTNIPVSPFSEACGGGACIPQYGTSQKLDSLGDRVMYRLAYRNLGDHASLVVNHSVGTGTGNITGVRWYEIRVSGPITSPCLSYPCVYQQGTYAPDSSYRWMGSIAMDKFGDIALGYSVSPSSTMSPSLRYTGRMPGDTRGQMESEIDILSLLNVPHGSQTSYIRWGDYSSMSVDPTDDCTFWFTTEYQPTNGNAWSTRIASFKFPSCP